MKKGILTLAIILASVILGVSQIAAQQRNITGKLTQTVEPGGWLIVENNQKYLILNASKFKNESWFKAGTEVSATGEIKTDAITIYQEGTPFQAAAMRPAQNSGTGGGSMAQVTNLTTVTITGEATTQAQPDTAELSISVVTQATNAADAQKQNAALTTATQNAVKNATGSNAEVKTSGYSLIPQRIYKENQPPIITGYEARNTISVILSDLNRVGKVIDAAGDAGANNIDGVNFTLRNDSAARNGALNSAVREAINKAGSMAQALGGRVVRIKEIREAGVIPRPIIYEQRDAFAKTAAAETPINVGTLEIKSQVELVAEIEFRMN